MKIHAEQIRAYIDYLKQVGLTVTLHGAYINQSAFLGYNYHQNPYCHYVKTVYGKWGTCVCHQEKVLDACKGGSFFGCCHAGVGEFVYPVQCGDEIACFVSVSGFAGKNTSAKARHFAKKHALDDKELLRLAEKYLDKSVPSKASVDAVLIPLVFMLGSYFEGTREKQSGGKELYHKVLRYVTENCHSRLTMQELSAHFNYSVSTISHLFLKNSGKSLPAYIAELRQHEAEWYLVNSQTSITEIAMFLGYSSSNYFSSVFKKAHGMTPKEYRKRRGAET